MAIDAINSLLKKPAMTGANLVQGVQGQIAGKTAAAKGQNPFSAQAHASDNKYGVGLVNSDLSNMSYALPNGKRSVCNTIGIG